MIRMKIFTVENGKVSPGATAERFTLKGAGVEIPAVIVGDEGRGRERGILPVQLTDSQYKEWQEKGRVRVESADLGTTKAGKPKLFVKNSADTNERIIVVFRTKIGFRGGNAHTGDALREFWRRGFFFRTSDAEKSGIPLKEEYTEAEVREYSARLNPNPDPNRRWDAGFERQVEFKPFPGEIIVRGVIAQGDAGRMGSGDQLIAVMPRDVVFRTGYSGRLYGQPSAHYYKWDGERLLVATLEERRLTDLF